MNRILAFIILIFTAIVVNAQAEKKVLFIGIDGVRSDGLTTANTPNIDYLMNTGTYTYTSWHLGITVSGPSWSAMLTGVWELKHGVTNNNYTGSNFNQYPYFPTRAKEYKPNLRAVQITSWAPMSDAVYNDGWDEKLIYPEDDDCVTAAVSILQNDTALDIIFVHIDDVDANGHANGFNPSYATYINAIEYTDQQVGQIITALQNRPNYANEDWLVMLTTDHGGVGNGHGGISKEEREIWWVAWGPSIISQELVVDLDNLSPLDYLLPNADDFDEAPLLTDIAVTALDHLLVNVDPTTISAWDLDGKSWLNKATSVDAITPNDPVKVYPNPVNDQIFVELAQTINEINWNLLNLEGRLVKTGSNMNVQNLNIEVADLPAGTYFLELNMDSKSSLKKITKE